MYVKTFRNPYDSIAEVSFWILLQHQYNKNASLDPSDRRAISIKNPISKPWHPDDSAVSSGPLGNGNETKRWGMVFYSGKKQRSFEKPGPVLNSVEGAIWNYG